MSHEKKYFIINFLHVVNKKYHISPTFTLQCYLRAIFTVSAFIFLTFSLPLALPCHSTTSLYVWARKV